MASATSSKKMREEATCSICLNLMAEPVSISCGHSYCQACILRFLDKQPRLPKESPCPQCRAPFQRFSLRPNKQLGGLIAALREMDYDMSCEEHAERLQLFCEEEGQLICWRCERGPRHQGHSTALVEDVCPGYKEKLQKAVTKLRQLEEECMNQKTFMGKQITEWNAKISVKRQKIQSDFKNLHSFLEEEEKLYLWRLDREREQTLMKLRDSEARLGRKRRQLESHILELEERCQGSAQKLLQDVKATLSRSQAVQLEAPEAFSLEVHTVCDVPKLYFDVKKLLRSHQVSVVLDPATGHRELIVSEDQRQVTRGCPQDNLDMSPRRFAASPCILGRESFTSGQHYFEVDVGEGTGWDVGVCVESVRRDTALKQEPQAGFWALRLCAKDGYVALTWPRTPLRLGEQPLVVGVLLDCEAGVVSFYNVTSGSHIFTFPKATFSDALRPYFQVYQFSPLFLPPPDA
ncbi:E3 ubiquitin-protein ligase TRIM38 [Sturnira hondurensis]|uniref:E3 ubiquitin-protein ligase TRIM38 n=1 Tax=Sturnira hondurensis TaxID=192404 RepID=UPI00187AF8E6|nr:E3 ubiquitin-protein ligase TRIM38 [Sturnira hondurensis]XP_036907308.1 E3 ubiquitin-protein ligase TRIM38 [Sturnira hondurensis]XP_036907309.1 E3 ubiquitin-protein ligase TRIM38 [Sturnira hondurensis]